MNNTLSIKQCDDLISSELTGIYPPEEIGAFKQIILTHLLHVTPAYLLLHSDSKVPNSVQIELNLIIQRLKQSEPLQYILGETEFYGRNFTVTPSVLIPRPETEELVEWVIKDNQHFTGKILDIGTGSGCIAISLALQIPLAQVFALDISVNALKVARYNANSLNAQVHFIEADILNYEHITPTSFDIIVSNPPYVCNNEKTVMQANVLDYEPHIALFVEDEDPLLFYRNIAHFAVKSLTPGGKLYCEINEAFGAETVELFAGIGLSQIELHIDINGKNRMIKAVLV
jgi:release factor glutamine methyltransferase